MDKMILSPEAIENDKSLGLPLIAVKKIFKDDNFNCRGWFSATDCVELAKDIAVRGLQQPIIVRPLREVDEQNIIDRGLTHKIIAGHRRFQSYVILEAEFIPAIIKPANITEFDAKDINAIENLQRLDLTMEQECNAIRHYWMADWSREEIAEKIGKSPGWVQMRLMLLEMPKEIQKLAGQGYIKTTDIHELNKHRNNPGDQMRLAGIIADKRKGGERNAVQYIKKKDKADTKKHRKREEIFEMMDYIRTVLKKSRDFNIGTRQIISEQGNTFALQCMAWCAGEIPTIDIHRGLKDFAEVCGVDYTVPEFKDEFKHLAEKFAS